MILIEIDIFIYAFIYIVVKVKYMELFKLVSIKEKLYFQD